jgi:TrmH family RNA methyltransferase
VAHCVYLHGVSDPGNVGTVIRTAHALVGGSIVLGPDCADPFGPHAVRASMGAVFSELLVRAGIAETPEPRAALVAHGGENLDALEGAATICLGAESLNVAAAAAIALQRICEGAAQAKPSGNPLYGEAVNDD